MIYRNEYEVNVDIKKSTTNVLPTFVQYDSAVLIFKIYDDGEEFNLANFERAEVVHKNPSGVVTYGLGQLITLDNGQLAIRYEYLGSEMNQVGNVLTSLILFSTDNSKLSILPFNVRIVKDTREDVAEQVRKEISVLDQIVEGADGIITRALEASQLIDDAMQDIYANLSFIEGIEQAELQREISETNRVHKGTYSNSVQYYKHNEVLYNGSTYRCLIDSIEILPTNTTKWTLVSQKGNDGNNGVTSVAGKTGAVVLNKSDVALGNVTNESKSTMFTSPTFTGIPTAPTPSSDTNTTQVATSAFVNTLVNSAKSMMGTLTLLTTSVKTSIVDAINSLKSETDAHTGNSNIHTNTTEKTTWNAKYTKPANGIPSTDLTNSIQTSLTKADSALQSVPDASTTTKGVVQLNNTLTSTSTKQAVTAAQAKVLNDSVSTHSSKIATTSQLGHVKPDGVTITIDSVGKISASGGVIPSPHTHETSEITGLDASLASKYIKPVNGIPKADLTSAVQTSLNKADSALQSVADASTTSKGIVQLNNTLTSTSTVQASTAAQVKALNDAATTHRATIATTLQLGHVKPDGKTITIDGNGVISSVGVGGGGSTGDHTHTTSQIVGLDGALSAKANLDSPTFIGIPNAPTSSLDTNTNQIATTAFVQSTLSEHSSDKTKKHIEVVDDLSLNVQNKGVFFRKKTTMDDIPSSSVGNHTHITSQIVGLDRALATKANLVSPTFAGTPTAPTATNSTNTNQVATTAFVKSAIDSLAGALSSLTTTFKTTIVEAINSLKSETDNHANNINIHTSSSDKELWNSKYDKPTTGIPLTDLSSGVQTTLNKVVDGTTSVKGILQLTNSVTSTSITDAATANAVKTVNDIITAHKTDNMHVHWLGDVTGTHILTATYVPITAYTDGLCVVIRIVSDTIYTSLYLNINNLGAKSLKNIDGTDVSNLKAKEMYTFRYNASTGTLILQGGSRTGALTNIQNDAITIYVSNSGLDTNNGLTGSTPVKTIAKAVELVKNLGAKKRVIQLTGAHIFDEVVNLSEIHGGTLEINGTYNNRATVKMFMLEDSTALIRILHVDIMVKGAITSTSAYGAYISRCNNVEIYYGTWQGMTMGVTCHFSKVSVEYITFNNVIGTCIAAQYGSYVYVSGLAGSNPASTSSTYDSYSSIITGSAGTVTSSSAQRKGSGGQIFFAT